MNLNGGTTPPGTSQPAVQLGPACAAPGDAWEVRLREEGDPEEDKENPRAGQVNQTPPEAGIR